MTDATASHRAVTESGDVVLLYRLFLGRDPENSARIEASRALQLDEQARAFIASAEFATRMAHAEKGQHLADIDWDLAPFLGLLGRITGAPSADAAPRSLRSTLAAALASPMLWPDFARLYGERATPLLALLAADHPPTADADWLGYIDFASDWLIRGWACRRNDPAPVNLGLMIDGKMFARIEASAFRQDVADALGLAGNCGFELRPAIPQSLRHEGAMLSLVDLSSGAPLPYRRPLLISPPATAPRSLEAELQALIRQVGDLTNLIAGFGVPGPIPVAAYQQFRSSYRIPAAPQAKGAMFSLILPLLAGEDTGLDETLSSLWAQDWQEWELIIVPGVGADLPDRMRQAIAADGRISVMKTVGLRKMVAARSVGTRAARGTHVITLHPGMTLEPMALAWLAHTAAQTGSRMIYTDHCHARPLGAAEHLLSDPALKPAFDHALLLQRDYIGPALCLDVALASIAAVSGDEAPGDLVFRAIERLEGKNILHLPLPLFRLPAGAPAEQPQHQSAALAHLSRMGQMATAARGAFHAHRQDEDCIFWPPPAQAQRLSIIIATRDRRDLLEPCIASIHRHLADPTACEIIVMDNRSRDPAARAYLDDISHQDGIRVLPFDEDFNWSRANNLAAAASTGDLLLFLNNDTEILTPRFDEVLRQQMSRPGVGALGCLLLFPDGTIQHAGTVIGTSGVAAHIGMGQSPAAPDLPDWHRLTRQVSAVTGAFLAVPAALFRDLGGFDEAALKITMNDVDFCLRVAEAGRTVLYTPAITCLHYESASRGHDEADREKSRRAAEERTVFQQRWQHRLRFDLFHGPGFSLTKPPFSYVVMPTADGVAAYLAYQLSPACAATATHQ